MPLIRNAKQVQQKSRQHIIEETGPNAYQVTSGTSGNVYHVWVGPENIAHCSCNWGQYRKSGAGSGCSHVVAVHEYRAEQVGRRVSAWQAGDVETIERQHRAAYSIGDGVILTTRKA